MSFGNGVEATVSPGACGIGCTANLSCNVSAGFEEKSSVVGCQFDAQWNDTFACSSKL